LSLLIASGAVTVSDDDTLSEPAAKILAQYPGPVTLYPSKLKWVSLFVVMTLTAALGAWSLLPDKFEPPIGFNSHTLQGTFLFVVGSFGALISLAALFTSYMKLSLDAAGLEFQSLWIRRRCLWRDTDEFTSTLMPRSAGMVYFVDFKDAARSPGFCDTAARALGLASGNTRLPDNYGLQVDDLVRLLTAWRERTLAQSR
jgi:hypothetical protein